MLVGGGGKYGEMVRGVRGEGCGEKEEWPTVVKQGAG